MCKICLSTSKLIWHTKNYLVNLQKFWEIWSLGQILNEEDDDNEGDAEGDDDDGDDGDDGDSTEKQVSFRWRAN